MKFELNIDSQNDAFADGGTQEVVRLLKEVTKRAEACDFGIMAGRLLDINGNTVGHYTMDADK